MDVDLRDTAGKQVDSSRLKVVDALPVLAGLRAWCRYNESGLDTPHMRYSEEAHRLHQDPDQPNAQRQSIHGSHQVNQSREKARNPDGMRRDQAWLALQLEAWARARHRRAGAGDLDLDSRTRPRRHWAP
ncbi:hypothetical protein MRS44_001314 [Fusarium solani]|uniref:uncharacterized protein n=1 Tax=Fusarium solani TaxID=169388 RepID=UPI0032C45FE0|nr:hypothetical protein MRS44_001314 [Fusarium solani]